MSDIQTIELNDLSSLPSVNFGSGAELLMNDKKTGSGGDAIVSDINIGDLESLEKELSSSINEIPDVSFKKEPENSSTDYHTSKSGLFGEDENKGVTFNIVETLGNPGDSSEPKPEEVQINQETNPSKPMDKTWDGFATFNDIPIGQDQQNKQPQMSKEDLLKEKFSILRKLEDLEKKGVNLSKKYTMESSLLEMQGEYETLISEKEKSNSVKFQGRMLMAAITGLEFLNNKFDPFDLKLDGWAEQINESVDDYDEIFAELHDKYKSKAKMAPELKLMFQLGGGAIMLHMTNSMFKTSMPGMDDIMRENPELMEQFTRAAVDKMGDDNPGLSGFMNNIMQPDVPTPSGPPPPPPVRTKGAYAEPPPQRESSGRPDIDFGRGLDSDGITINESFSLSDEKEVQQKSKRVEMEGPTEINELLSGLKSKSIEKSNELEEIESVKPPKKKRGSNKNTISLNL
tara:strand:- start:3068 stop:4441 length:1374 start_codon:yes stop_codon:yes gene_type:complete